MPRDAHPRVAASVCFPSRGSPELCRCERASSGRVKSAPSKLGRKFELMTIL